MANDNPQPYGNEEIISLTTPPEIIIINESCTISGTLYGNISSTQARILINDNIIDITNIQNNGFTFTFIMPFIDGKNVIIKVQGISNNTVNSENVLTLPIGYKCIAESMSQIYLLMKDLLEKCFHEHVESYDPLLKTGDGVWMLVTKIEEMVI